MTEEELCEGERLFKECQNLGMTVGQVTESMALWLKYNAAVLLERARDADACTCWGCKIHGEW